MTQKAMQSHRAAEAEVAKRTYVRNKLAIDPKRANETTNPRPITRCDVGNSSAAYTQSA
jgi:CRISPR/Cas system CSM-associated protein Csm3 (group 7 of RAMP superfamily)